MKGSFCLYDFMRERAQNIRERRELKSEYTTAMDMPIDVHEAICNRMVGSLLPLYTQLPPIRIAKCTQEYLTFKKVWNHRIYDTIELYGLYYTYSMDIFDWLRFQLPYKIDINAILSINKALYNEAKFINRTITKRAFGLIDLCHGLDDDAIRLKEIDILNLYFFIKTKKQPTTWKKKIYNPKKWDEYMNLLRS